MHPCYTLATNPSFLSFSNMLKGLRLYKQFNITNHLECFIQSIIEFKLFDKMAIYKNISNLPLTLSQNGFLYQR